MTTSVNGVSSRKTGTGEPASEAAILRMNAGRAKAAELMPYMSSALFAMKPVEVPGLGTCATDHNWRFYWDPETLLACTVTEAAWFWLHEAGHNLRDHHDRFRVMSVPPTRQRAWNIAGDAAINADIRDAGIRAPQEEARPFPDRPEWVPGGEQGMTTEQMYRRIIQDLIDNNMCPDCGQPMDNADQGKDQQGKDQGQGQDSQPGQGKDQQGQDQQGQDQGQGQDSQPGQGKDQQGQGDSGQGDQGQGDQGQDGQGDSGQGDQSQGQGQGSQGGGSGSGHRCATHQHGPNGSPCNCGAAPGDGDAQRLPGDCGSGAGGRQRPWEQGDGNDDGSVNEGRAERIRQTVARQITEHVKQIGKVPGGWDRWARITLEPAADWRKELQSNVRKVTASVAGRRNYTYSRPSRKSSAVPNVILPAMRAPKPPQAALVWDTSASVTDEMESQIQAEVGAILKQARGEVRIIACDAAAAEVQTIRKVDKIRLQGGGGTDMRVGIQKAAELRPHADVIITGTDGDTPWPVDPPEANPTARYIALLVDGDREDVPEWMHKIVIKKGELIEV